MSDDLISREALKKEFADRARAARNWKESALNNGNDESAIRADAILSFLTEVKLTIDNAPAITTDIDNRLRGIAEHYDEEGCRIYYQSEVDSLINEIYLLRKETIDNAPTVLPKGHGRLIDADAVIANGVNKGFCNWYDEIKYAPTIIEADKEAEEDD